MRKGRISEFDDLGSRNTRLGLMIHFIRRYLMTQIKRLQGFRKQLHILEEKDSNGGCLQFVLQLSRFLVAVFTEQLDRRERSADQRTWGGGKQRGQWISEIIEQVLNAVQRSTTRIVVNGSILPIRGEQTPPIPLFLNSLPRLAISQLVSRLKLA